jgi:hypothetical protein
MKTYSTGAKKDVQGKLPYHLIPKEAMDSMAAGLQCGTTKGYDAHNWQGGLPYMEVHVAALLRHLYKWIGGEEDNIEINAEGKEFATHHLDNAMAHMVMLVTQVRRNRTDLDDRYK